MAYTNIDDPSAYFQTALYTGNAGFNTITNDGNSDLAPDFIWGKCRSTTKTHFWYDTTRGAEKRLESDNTGVEDTGTNGILNFYTDGFRTASGNTENDNGETYVAWQWKANGGTTSSNTDGDITSTVQVNQDAGFSIMTYSGTTGDVHTIGHGLGVTPQVWIVKQRSGNSEFQDWFFWHHQMAADNIVDNRMLFLNTTAAVATYTGINAVTSSTIRVKSSTTAQNGDTYVAYAFAEKQGYSKFGSYIGNGSGTSDGTFDGPMVYTGFKPAWVMVKSASASGGDEWVIWDSTRPSRGTTGNGNYINNKLYANTTAAESGNVYDAVDFLSNGFKIRTGRAGANTSGRTYIYMAFAKNPFVTSTGIPTTAR